MAPKVFLASASTLPGLVVRTESGGDGSPNSCLSQCHSVWTPVQLVFYGLRLLSSTRAFGVDCCVKLVCVSLKEGGVTGSKMGEENSIAPRGDSPTVGRP